MSEGRDYIVTVWIENVVVQDEATPDVYGVITLTDEDREILDSRLYALEGEDFVNEYSINEVEVPERLTVDGILADIVEAWDDNQTEVTGIWNKIQSSGRVS